MKSAVIKKKLLNNQQKLHVFLSLNDKLKIIEGLKAGETVTSLARQYNVSRAAVSNLKTKKGNMKDVNNLKKLNEMALNKRKVIKRVHNEILERAIVMWYNEIKNVMGLPISGPMLCEKALHLNEKLNGSEKFKATTGWLTAFKRRYGVRITHEDKLSIDGDVAREFCTKFQQFINEENYDLSLVFNADESGIMWKSLPKIEKDENPLGWKCDKEKVSVLFCANADGSYALPLLIIGKSWSSRSSLSTAENIQQLPVMYHNQSSACMTTEIFLDWYMNIFIPSVQEMQTKTGNYGRVLLLIDTAKCHPSKEILNSVNENFQVIFIPPRITTLIQPMNQGIIEKTKRMYRKLFIESMLNYTDEMNLDEFMEFHTMEDCCFMMSNAFESVTMLHLKNAWNKLYGLSQLDEKNIDQDDEMLEDKVFCHMLHKIRGFENVYSVTIKTWLNTDLFDLGWEPLIDEEIIEIVTKIDETIDNDDNEENADEPISDGDFEELNVSKKENEIQESIEIQLEQLEKNDDNFQSIGIEESVQNIKQDVDNDDDDEDENFQLTEIEDSEQIMKEDYDNSDNDNDNNDNNENNEDDGDEEEEEDDDENVQSMQLEESQQPKIKEENTESKIDSQSTNVEIAIQFLHEWCRQRKEYTESDCQLLSKWESLARKASEENN